MKTPKQLTVFILFLVYSTISSAQSSTDAKVDNMIKRKLEILSKSVKLTEEQKSSITAIAKDFILKVKAADVQKDKKEALRTKKSASDEYQAKLSEIFTPEQKAAYEAKRIERLQKRTTNTEK